MTIGEIIPAESYDWMIYEHDNKFKVKSGEDGTTVHETDNLTDAIGAFNYCTDAGGYTVVKKPKPATVRYPISAAVQIGSNDYICGLSGTMGTDVEVRPTSNTPAFEFIDTALRASLENILCTHIQSGYTKSLVQLSNKVREVYIGGLRFGTDGSGLYKGNALGFDIFNQDKYQYEIVVENIIARDLENFTHWNLQVADGTGGFNAFISSIIFNQCFPWNCKRVSKAVGVTGAKLLAVTFDNVHFQWSASNSLAAGEGVYDFNDLLSSWQMKISNSQTWDYPANANAINMGANTELMAVNSNVTRVGGNTSGIAKFKSLEYYNHAYGYYETNAVIGQRDYLIPHNLGLTPKEVYCQVLNQDINNQFAVICPKDKFTTTNFTARLLGYPVAGTNNLKFAYRVYYN